MKLHLLSYLLSLFLNFLLFAGIFSSFYWATHKIKEEIRISLVSPLSTEPSFTQAEALPLKSPTQPLSQTSSIKPQKEESSEKETLSEKIEKLRAKREAGKFSKLTQEELGELEGKLRGLKGKSQVEGGEIQNRGKTQSDTKGSEETFSGALSEGFLLLIKRKLQTNFEVPIYLRQKSGLRAIVSLEISPQGEILNYKFLQSSVEPLFNQAVERCLQISQPFPVNRKIKIVVEFKAEGIGKIN